MSTNVRPSSYALLSASPFVRWACFCLLIVCFPALTLAAIQEDITTPDDFLPIAIERIASLKQQVEENSGLDQEAREKLQAELASVESKINQVKSKAADLATAEEAIQTADRRSNEFKRKLERLKSDKPEPIDQELDTRSISEELQQLRLTEDSLAADLKANRDANAKRITRRQESRPTLDSLNKQLQEKKRQLANAAGDESFDSQLALLNIQSDLALTELQMSVVETQLQQDEVEEQAGLLASQKDLIELELQRTSEKRRQLEELQRTQLEYQANQRVQKAIAEERAAQQTHPLLVESYKANTKLAEQTLSLEQGVTLAKASADELNDYVSNLESKFRETEIRVETIGLTSSVGALLRKHRADLVAADKLRRFNIDAKKRIDELQNQVFEIDQQREELTPASIRTEIENAYGPQTDSMWESLEQPINEVIILRKQYLAAVTTSLGRLFSRLLDIQQYESTRKVKTANFREYINERILWIRSNGVLFSTWEIDDSDRIPFQLSNWTVAGAEIAKAFGFDTARSESEVTSENNVANQAESNTTADSLPEGFSERVSFRMPLIVLLSLLCAGLLIARSRMRRTVDRLGEEAARGSCVTYWPTARSLVLTILIAISAPLLPLTLGLVIETAPFQGSELFRALGDALIAAAVFAIPVEILRRMTHPNGLAIKHFDWPKESVAKLKNNLNWVVIPGTLLVFSAQVLYHLDLVHRVDSLERILFIAGMGIAVYFTYKTLNPQTGIFASYLKQHEHSWANQTSAIWFGFILIIPMLLAFLAFWGYYFTALNLGVCAFRTLVFALVLETIRGLAERLVLVRRRKAFIQTAKRKRQARIEAEAAKQKELRKQEIAAAVEGEVMAHEPTSAPMESIETLTEIQPEDIDENAKQAYKLISLSLFLIWFMGMWAIWSEVLPALKAFDDYVLWPAQVAPNEAEFSQIDSSSTSESSGSPNSERLSSGNPMTVMPSRSSSSWSETDPDNSVTVRDLLLFVMISIITWIAATNLPSAFEGLFLDQLPFDRSFRYAIKALISYAIVMVGVIFAFSALSIGWTNVQWLATALTFGLAFGLQEIFANFVAGIILMFERPMRIGDLITVDQFTGVVTKIRTRATTIVHWDRKEYVIPNKDFITGRFVNWTLTDAVNRIEINVGIAYGSNVELAKSTLREIMTNHPQVIEEPPCQVVFKEFGESSLNIEIRCFISEVEGRAQVIDSLHTQINAEFEKAGIEISFPQRDLHVRSIDTAIAESISKRDGR